MVVVMDGGTIDAVYHDNNEISVEVVFLDRVKHLGPGPHFHPAIGQFSVDRLAVYTDQLSVCNPDLCDPREDIDPVFEAARRRRE